MTSAQAKPHPTGTIPEDWYFCGSLSVDVTKDFLTTIEPSTTEYLDVDAP